MSAPRFCPFCGTATKETEREKVYDTDTGELKGYNLTIKCPRWWRPFTCGLNSWWGYEDDFKYHENKYRKHYGKEPLE